MSSLIKLFDAGKLAEIQWIEPKPEPTWQEIWGDDCDEGEEIDPEEMECRYCSGSGFSEMDCGECPECCGMGLKPQYW